MSKEIEQALTIASSAVVNFGTRDEYEPGIRAITGISIRQYYREDGKLQYSARGIDDAYEKNGELFDSVAEAVEAFEQRMHAQVVGSRAQARDAIDKYREKIVAIENTLHRSETRIPNGR